MTERVVVTQGPTSVEFTYGDYQDWNNPLNKIEVLYAGKMVERQNGMRFSGWRFRADVAQRAFSCKCKGRRNLCERPAASPRT